MKSNNDKYQLNNNVLKIFILVQSFAFLAYLLEPKLRLITKSMLPGLEGPQENKIKEYIFLILMALFTALICSKIRTYKAENIEFRFNKTIFLCLMFIEVYFIYILNGQSLSLNIDFARQYRSDGLGKLGYLKISTLIFYMYTMVLSAKIEAIKLENPRRRRREYQLLRLLLLSALVIFAMKDVYAGARGSTLNFIAFYLIGKTYVNRFYLNKDFILSPRILGPVFILIFLIIVLTINRTGSNELLGMLVYDSLIIKFVGNLEVAIQLISGDLYLREGMGGYFRSAEYLDWGVDRVSVVSFYPIFENFVQLFTERYDRQSMYFHIYGNNPFNSASYLFYLLVGGGGSFALCVTIIVLIRLLGRINPAFNFFSYATLFYFGFVSFTGYPLTSIPFILIPIFALLFKYVVRLKTNPLQSSTDFIDER
jgi:hypothetical protein